MSKTQDEQIAKFQRLFPQRLEAFLVAREKEIREPFLADAKEDDYKREQWKPQVTKYKTSGQMSLILSYGDKTLSFTLEDYPKNLPLHDTIALRQFIYECCGDHGLHTHEIRMPKLPKDVLEAVRKGDQEAWNTFITKHQPGFLQTAARQLQRLERPTNIDDTEDFVNTALLDAFLKLQSLSETQNKPHNWINNEIFSIIYDQTNIKKRQRQDVGSRWRRMTSRLVATPSLPESDIDDNNREQTPLGGVIEHARQYMNERQQELLDIVMIEPDLKDKEIAKKMTPAINHEKPDAPLEQIKRQRISQIKIEVSRILCEAAQELVPHDTKYGNIASLLNLLERQNEEEKAQRKQRKEEKRKMRATQNPHLTPVERVLAQEIPSPVLSR